MYAAGLNSTCLEEQGKTYVRRFKTIFLIDGYTKLTVPSKIGLRSRYSTLFPGCA